MKKLLSLVLALCLMLGCTSALAAGKLVVNQETYTPIELYSDSYYAYIFVEVTNAGDKNVEFGSGILEVLNADGDAVESFDLYTAYPEVLAPGDVGYISYYRGVDDAKSVEDIPDYLLTVSGKSSKDEAPLRLTATGVVEEVPYWNETQYQVTLTITNDTDKTIYDATVPYAIYDASGKLLYADYTTLWNIGLPAGSTIEMRQTINDAFLKLWKANNTIPTTVTTFAYVEK
ncbi:MAG: FxLYD domain-containing protein [Clostridia bacterium]|nr:FxLYD domain-containing protein [Clostridia bacterium]